MIDAADAGKLSDSVKQRAALADDFKSVFGTPEGERVLFALLREGGLLEIGVVAGAPDLSNVNHGKRALALYILDMLRFDVGRVLELMRRRDEAEARRVAG